MGRAVPAVTVIVILAGGWVGAHHSYAEFLLDRTASVEGTLEGILIGNPHTILTLRTKESNLYTAEWRPVVQLERMGVERSTLRVGDVIIVSGNPSRDPSTFRLARLTEVRRPSDGWTWRLDDGRASVRPSTLR